LWRGIIPANSSLSGHAFPVFPRSRRLYRGGHMATLERGDTILCSAVAVCPLKLRRGSEGAAPLTVQALSEMLRS
jgi:hypothetical protein